MLILLVLIIAAFFVWFLALSSTAHYSYVGQRIQKQTTKEEWKEELPPLTIVIVSHNQSLALRRHLPVILEQDYASFEVIVIDMSSTDETKDILERLELQHANLRHTFTPTSARDISIERLALTLGFRMATHEWVVLTRPDCEPLTPQWLTRIGETIVAPRNTLQSPRLETPDMVLGLSRYDEQRATWLDKRMGFLRLWNQIENIGYILKGHAAIEADPCNLAYRKSFFMEHGGFASSQELKSGAERLLVNHNSTPSNTALMIAPTAMVVQDRIGSLEQWKAQRVFAAETRRHERHASLYRCLQGYRLTLPWLLLVLFLVLWCMSLNTILTADASTSLILMYMVVIFLPLLLIYYLYYKACAFYRTTKALSCRSYNLSFLILEMALPFWVLSANLSRRLAHRNEFRKKFV